MALSQDIINFLVKMVVNPLFWLLIIALFAGAIFIFLKIRRKRALIYPAIEVTDYGYNTGLKCGWIGIKTFMRGYWWTGRDVMRTDNNEIIIDFSEEDFVEINGKRGVMFYRDPVNRNLFPISKHSVRGKEFIATVPPSEYIEAALDIIREANIETTDWKDRLIQFGAWALVVVFSLVAIIVIVQMVKNGQQSASDLILKSGETCIQSAKEVCTAICKAGSTGGTPAP